MSSNPIRLQKLLQKYLSGSATQQELEEFWKLMSELSDNDLVELDLQNLWSGSSHNNAASEVDWNKVYHTLQQKIADHEFDFSKSISSARRKKYIITAIAACVVLFALIFIGRLNILSHPSHKSTANTETARQNGHQTISLPDGTMVTLNHGSKLDYPKVFDQASRDVYLTGEAFFDVKHDAEKPFQVHTGRFVTRVLGTAFNIKAYDSDAQVSVTVARGKVQVESGNSKEPLGILSAGDQLIIDKESSKTNLNKTDVNRVTEWKVNDLIFNNATVDEAVIALGNRYGVSFVFEHEALRRCRFTANFSDDSLNLSLDVICTLIHASWEQTTPRIIILKGEGCE